MLADSRATSGSHHPIGAKMKIHEIAAGKYKGALLGVSSDVPGMGEALKDWVTSGMDKEAFGKVECSVGAILALPNRSVYLFDENLLLSGPLDGDLITIGTGKKYAYGAYKAGADARRAMEVAILCDPLCGHPIVSLQLRTPDANQPSMIRRFIRLLRNFGGGTAT
ncbi:peptidase S14 [Rhizobium ruizarguesonis]|nr:peptidase S14 [Rhizobium ruizarguesonis]